MQYKSSEINSLIILKSRNTRRSDF